MAARIRLTLFAQAASLGALSAAVLAALGLPLLAARALGPRAFAGVVLADAVAVAIAGAVMLSRWVARPVERILAAAARIGGAAGELPPLGVPGDAGGPPLSRAAVAFERTAAALEAERARVAAQIAELEGANARLAAAREELLRAERLATVGRLASGIAHEVGNPLGAIAGFAELARGRIGAGAVEEADDLVARIGGEAARIDRIVRDLLDFARPTALALAPVALGPVVDAALRLARVQPRFRDVRTTLALPPGLPLVLADEGRLAQVLLNLLLNAGDAMEGRGAVAVRASAGDGRVLVEVEDEGPGIAPADLPRIFDPFFTTKGPGRGTGLGLSVCVGILDALGGEISAGNAPGGGAVFRLRLRSAPPPATA